MPSSKRLPRVPNTGKVPLENNSVMSCMQLCLYAHFSGHESVDPKTEALRLSLVTLFEGVGFGEAMTRFFFLFMVVGLW